ncbi:EAL domain-containing protein [Massilia jejuensis]|uniref:EAL domain-containing protein n=1 Tax=Massilia jejuensis TaxID=648894 RepID=A0ABW0PIH9_9BURK
MTRSVPTANAAFLVDADGTITAWNKECETLLGFTPAMVIGQPLGGLLADTDPQDGGERWRGLAADHCRTNHVALRRADGSTVNADLALSPQIGLDGQVQAWVAAVDNVHDPCANDAFLVGRTPLAAIIDFLPGTVYALNREGRFVLWNRRHERITGLAPEEMAATNALELFDLKVRPLVADTMRRVFEHGEEVAIEADFTSRSGRETPMLLCGARVSCNGDQYLFGMGMDISSRRRQESMLRLRERALHAASNGIVITGIDGGDTPIEYVNPAFERISGYSASEIIGRDSRFMAAPGMDDDERLRVQHAIAAREPVHVVFRNLRKNGELFWNELSVTPVQDEHGATTHFIGIVVDVTESRQRTAHLEHEVNHDALTGLANRNLLRDRIEQALHLSQRQKSQVGVVLIDLNNFKAINDTFGHEAGDVVLKVVARRLQAAVRDIDTVARLSGDEFVLVLVSQPSLRFTLRMIERLRQNLTQPVSFMHREIALGASLGVAVYPHDGVTAAELVRSADVAMYHAKATGGSEIYFFSDDMKSSSEARQRLDAGMARALERKELFMLYQPCIDARSGRVTCFEALLRWRHPEQGVLLPSSFLAEAEESGRIVEFGAWVLDQACAFLRDLKALGVTDVPVTVNVSAREYGQQDFVSGLASRLAAFGLDPGSLQIEMREETVIRNPGLVRDLAMQLRALGLTLSIDAFGQGMSDLGFLRELAVGQLKLSKESVHAIVADEPESDGCTMARTLIDIAHNLRVPVIGEAVETRAQRDFLTSYGCEALQGLLLSEPMGMDAARAFVRDRMPV